MRAIHSLWVLVALAGCAVRIAPLESPEPAPAISEIQSTIFLVGDAGAPKAGGEPVLQALEALLPRAPDSTLILFLGDNVYPSGIPAPGAPDAAEAERRLAAQVALSSKVRVVFVPGNHDWDKSGPEGWERIRRQGRLITELSGGRARLFPEEGCPGPVRLDLGTGLRLLLLDTEWWLFSGEKPGQEAGCPVAATESAVLAALQAELETGKDRQVLVAAHHPLATGGVHGGFFTWTDHLFPLRNLHSALWLPLPLIGSLYPAIRGSGVTNQDLSGDRNRAMRKGLEAAMACYPPAIFAAGHDHGLQILDRGTAPLLAVSGGGFFGNTTALGRLPETRLALSEAGFMRLDLLRDGRLRLGVLTVSRAGVAHEVDAVILPPARPERESACQSGS